MSILLVGTGYMGREYAKVLGAMGLDFFAIGRGLKEWLKTRNIDMSKYHQAIVAVTEDQLGIVTRELIYAGCKEILVEKPGGFDIKDVKLVAAEAKKNKTKVFVGYNRRFYASTLAALDIIRKEGISSFNFDFTERSYVVETSKQSDRIKREWFLQNSTHVIDMAFFMGGWSKKLTAFKKGGLKWHPSGAIYSGAGISEKGALFSYHANWSSAGKWSVEVMTPKTKLIFRPLEKLQIQKYGSMAVEDYPIDDKLDTQFKPGLYKQVEAFLKNPEKLLTIAEQVNHLKHYEKIKRGN